MLIASTLNLITPWNSFMGDLTSSFGPLLTLLGIVGAVLIVFGIVKWLWAIRRSGSFQGASQHHGRLGFTVLAGGILAAPTFVIPVLLTIIDLLVNSFVPLLQRLFGG